MGQSVQAGAIGLGLELEAGLVFALAKVLLLESVVILVPAVLDLGTALGLVLK